MNSRARMQAAMSHEEPDRVPAMCQLALGHYFLHCDQRPSEIWLDSGAFADALVQLQRRYRFDGILVNLPGRPPDDNPHTFGPDAAPLPRARYESVDLNDPRTYRLPGYVWGKK